MSPDGVSTGYRITNNVIQTSAAYPCMHLGDTRTGRASPITSVATARSASTAATRTRPARTWWCATTPPGIDASACSGCTIDHNQTVTYTGGVRALRLRDRLAKGTASDGTDIGLNSCGATQPPPPPPPADTTAPETTITSGPTGTTNDNTPTFAFTATEANSVFECRVDSGVVGRLHEPVDDGGAERRRAHGRGPRHRRGRQHRRLARDALVHGRHGAAARHDGAGHDDHVGPDGHDERQHADVRVHVERGRLDLRVPGRRRRVGELHEPVDDGGAERRRRTRSRSARPTWRATPTPRPRRARSPSTRRAAAATPRRPTRRSPRARPARRRRRTASFAFTRASRARPSSASSTPAPARPARAPRPTAR